METFVKPIIPAARMSILIYALLLAVVTGTANAATFVVTKFVDTNDGICNEDCSLREAIAAAEAATTDDEIVFDPTMFFIPRTITLNFGELKIFRRGSLTINGPAQHLTINGRNASRIFLSEAVLTISNVTLTGGNGIGHNAGAGGAIFNAWASPLTLNKVIITGNTANQAGGIYNVENSPLTLNDSVVSNNSAPFRPGGIYNSASPLILNRSVVTANSGTGLVNSGATAVITDSTISNNVGEGGIHNYGTIDLVNSTVSGNTTTFSGGGGIFSSSNQTVVNITNSTISGNSATQWGGGIYIIPGATINLVSSTVTDNIADSDDNGTDGGGGIANHFGGAVNARSTIIAANKDNSGAAPDFSGTLNSQGHNLLSSTAGLTVQGITTGNILGQNPLLLPLGSYGGPTKTHALKPASPAIDNADPLNFPRRTSAGRNGLATAISTDRRCLISGLSRSRL